MTESGDNFLLSCSDLKNLDLMSKSFPEYTGKVRSGHAKATADIEEILNEPYNDKPVVETGDCIVPHVQEENISDTDIEVKVRQDETLVKIEYTDDLDEEQMLAAEAYSLLYGLGSFTYNNLVEEGVMLSVQWRKVRRRPIMMTLMEMTILDPIQR